ncbi:MAG TPA: cytochrome c [Sphingobium sp.]|uniref:c-type cytochrome n=1 Tax=Sphingobium sp. TaxID=1912891 RepID=UPI002ED435DC
MAYGRAGWLGFFGLSMVFLASPALAGGQQNFAARCSMCHQTTGAGLPGQFPRLSGRVAQIAASPDGRAYLTKVLLNGMFGSITVDGQPINGLMPGMGAMNDQDIADILNYVVSLKKVGKPASFTAAEIARVRASGKMSASEVATERTRLATKGTIP